MSYKHTYKFNQLERGDVQTVIPQLCGCSISLSNNKHMLLIGFLQFFLYFLSLQLFTDIH
jgi:hypothetical protein